MAAFLAPLPLSHAVSGPCPAVSAARPRRAVVAVLDEPAVNPHLKRESATTVRDYLTRRAVHSVAYYFQEFGDSATRQWILRFDNFAAREASETFLDGDAFLSRMLAAAPVTGTVVQRGSYRREFPFTITPSRVARSVLAARAQLAGEWASDLSVVAADNFELQRSACERSLGACVAAQRRPVIEFDVDDGDQSPLRFRNFQNLMVLVTQHAVARLQPFLRDTSNHEYMYLSQFVQQYGPLKDGDDFVEKLMAQPMQDRTNPTFVLDPRAIAMHIMDLRNVIAKEWVEVMEQVPEEQLRFTRGLLERSAELPSWHGVDPKEN